MAARDIALNLLIKAKDLASSVVSKFRGEVVETKADSDKLDKSLKQTGEEAADLGNKVEKDAMRAGAAIGKMAQRYDAAGKPIASVGENAKKTNKQLDKTEDTAGKAGSSINSLTHRLLALAGAVVGVRSIVGALRSLFTTGDDFEKLALQMEQTMGSIEAGRRATEWIKEFTTNTPLQLTQTTETFITLKNFGINPLNGAMQAIVDQANKLGGGYERVRGISLALGQAWAKQKLQGEEILQLLERGVPVWDLLAQVTGKSAKQLNELSSAGALGREVIKQLIDEMGRQSVGAAADNMSLLSGYVSNLKDEWALFQNEIAKTGALDFAKSQLRELLQTIQQMRESGELQQVAKRISDAIIGIGQAVRSTVEFIAEHIGLIKLLGLAWAGLKIRSFIGSVFSLAGAFKNNLNTAVAESTTRFKTLRSVLKASIWLAAADAIFSLTGNLIDLAKAKSEVKKSTQDLRITQSLATQKLNEFNQAAGTNFQTLREVNRAVKSGVLVWSEQAGAYRLAGEAAKLAAKAQEQASSADDVATQRKQQLNAATRALLATYDESQGKGKSLKDTITALGEAARLQGKTGIEALSIAIQDLSLRGKESKDLIKTELVDYLVSLNDDQFDGFGQSIIDGIDHLDDSAKNAGVRLSFLHDLLNTQLSAAAKRVGVDLDGVLTGVDSAGRIAIERFGDLVKALAAAETKGEDADKVFRAGLLETLKKLDTSEEVEAVTRQLRQLEEQGVITSEQLQVGLDKARQRLTELKKAATDAADGVAGGIQDMADAANQQAEATEGASNSAASMAGIINQLSSEVAQLGNGAAAAFAELQGMANVDAKPITDDIESLERQLSDATQTVEYMTDELPRGFSAMRKVLISTARNAHIVKREFLEQKIAVEELLDSYERGAISAGALASQGRAAANSMDLLNESDLSALESAIQSAEQRMLSLRDSSLSTLEGLQNELDRLRGNTVAIERREYEARVRDLESALEEARKSGDASAIKSARESLEIAQRIHREKLAQIDAEKKAETERSQRQQSTAQSSASPSANNGSAQTIRLEAGGQVVEVQTNTPEELLSVLESAGMRTSTT